MRLILGKRYRSQEGLSEEVNSFATHEKDPAMGRTTEQALETEGTAATKMLRSFSLWT